MSQQPNDPAYLATERMIAEMEKKVSKEYAKAVEEIEQKLQESMKAFEADDEVKRQQLADGEITQEAYNTWRQEHIMNSQRWADMRDNLAQDLHNANRIARSIISGYMPDVYAVNHNYGTYEVESGLNINTSFVLYDRQTVEGLLRDNPALLQPPGKNMTKVFGEFYAYKNRGKKPSSQEKGNLFKKLIDENRDIRWQKGKIQSVMLQGILQGESIPNIARRIARDLGELNRAASVRYARTAATSAQNRGRIDSYDRAESMGIDLKKEWMSTKDKRTRDSHIALDGEKVIVGAKFSNGCEYPGDPRGPAEEIWNCRCTLVAVLKGFDNDRYTAGAWKEGITFEEWEKEHKEKLNRGDTKEGRQK